MKDFLPSLETLQSAAAIVYETMAPTPQYAWPLLRLAVGTEIWVKHENHTAIGAFKLRGGLGLLPRFFATQWRISGRHQRHARQSWPVGRICRTAVRHCRDHRRSAWQ
jgi:threonine dehydratase